jgi:hypothetical protein
MKWSTMTRWRAAGLHLLISAAIAVAVLVLMLGLWYPGPLFDAAGGNDLMFLVVGVDVIIGPLITLLIFRIGKWGLKFDLTVIALLQIGALLYGLHIVYLARPAYIVFVKDRFEVATPAELEPEDLAEGRRPEFRRPPWLRPLWVASDFPTDRKEQQRLVELALSGMDVQHFPKFYVPYQDRSAQILAKAKTLAQLRQEEPIAAQVVAEYLADAGIAEGDVRLMTLRARFAWVQVVLDAHSAEPRKMLITEREATSLF